MKEVFPLWPCIGFHLYLLELMFAVFAKCFAGTSSVLEGFQHTLFSGLVNWGGVVVVVYFDTSLNRVSYSFDCTGNVS